MKVADGLNLTIIVLAHGQISFDSLDHQNHFIKLWGLVHSNFRLLQFALELKSGFMSFKAIDVFRLAHPLQAIIGIFMFEAQALTYFKSIKELLTMVLLQLA